jgi:hypothetical protein
MHDGEAGSYSGRHVMHHIAYRKISQLQRRDDHRPQR